MNLTELLREDLACHTDSVISYHNPIDSVLPCYFFSRDYRQLCSQNDDCSRSRVETMPHTSISPPQWLKHSYEDHFVLATHTDAQVCRLTLKKKKKKRFTSLRGNDFIKLKSIFKASMSGNSVCLFACCVHLNTFSFFYQVINKEFPGCISSRVQPVKWHPAGSCHRNLCVYRGVDSVLCPSCCSGMGLIRYWS